MKASPMKACLVTAAVVISALPLARAVSAADLYGENYAEPPYDDGGQYADEGYNDRDAPPPDRYGEAPYGRGPAEPLPGSIKDGYPVPMPPPRYSERAPERYVPARPERYACLDRWQIRQQLRRDGWVDIRPMGGDGEVVSIRARRFDSGRVFQLRVDRCSGSVLAARPQYLRTFAYRDWRWDRGY